MKESGLKDGIGYEDFRVVFEHASDGMIISDLNTHKIITVNPKLCRMFGYSREEFQKITYFDMSAGFQPYADDDVRKELEHVPLGDDVPSLEWLCRKKSGENFWVEVSRCPFDVNSKERILAIVREIGVRKEAERAKVRYRELYESSRDGYALVDLNFRFQEFNSSFRRMLGYDREELLGLSVADITPEKWHHKKKQILGDLRGRGYSDFYEKEYVGKDGFLVPVEIRSYLYRNDKGEPSGFWGFVRDISERKRSHASLSEVRSRHRCILEAIPDQIFEISAQGVFTGYRGNLSDLKFPPEMFVGKKAEEVFPGEIAKKIMHHIRLALETGILQVYEYGMKIGSMDRFFESRMIAIDHDNLIVIVRDITGRKARMDALLEENRRLQVCQGDLFRFAGLIGKSESMQRVYGQIRTVAESSAGVIVYGETGTGKELVARAIHDHSPFRKHRFLAVNCGAIPEELAESLFFGHRKGAFSGADAHQDGFLLAANGGTLFLDEVGEISLNLQTKLLRAIETSEFTPVGSHTPRKSKFRIVAATNRNLMDLVASGRMREDFFFRIHVLSIDLPPLRERKEDIPFLAEHFLHERTVKGVCRLNSEILDMLFRHHWPGNVRELNNVLHRYISMGEIHLMHRTATGTKEKPLVGFDSKAQRGQGLKSIMENVEKEVIEAALKESGGKRMAAAARLMIDRKTLYEKMKRYGVN